VTEKAVAKRDRPRAAIARRWGRRALKWGFAAALLYSLGVLVVTYAITHPIRFAPRDSPRRHGLPQEDVALTTSDGVRLAAWHVPRADRRGTVVVVHGNAGNREQMLPQVLMLHQAGFAVLAPDLRGAGTSDAARRTFGYEERLDVAAAVEWLREQPGGDGEPIAALGVSMGAAACTLSLNEGTRFDALILDSTFAHLDEVVPGQFWAMPPGLREAFARSVERAAEQSLDLKTSDVNPATVLAAHPEVPVLVIHGDQDRLAPVAQAEKLRDAAGHADLWIVPRAGHAKTQATAPSEYEERVVAFLRQHLRRGVTAPASE